MMFCRLLCPQRSCGLTLRPWPETWCRVGWWVVSPKPVLEPDTCISFTSTVFKRLRILGITPEITLTANTAQS